MHKIFLLRHGKATNPKEGQDDFKRALNKKGIAQINLVGNELNSSNQNIGLIISSSALRTTETTEITNFHLNVDKIKYDKNLYLARHDFILKKIIEMADSKEILYVGHNFGISDLASYLAGYTISMLTGMLVEISFEIEKWSDIKPNSGTVVRTYVPNVFVP